MVAGTDEPENLFTNSLGYRIKESFDLLFQEGDQTPQR
jgi:hypothetical protein